MADPRDGDGRGAGQRGPERRPGSPVPDGALIGGIILLILVPVSVWCAAELGGRLEHGHWPAVGLAGAALALRHLAVHPGAFTAAWPAQARPDLPGPGAFWGVWAALVGIVLGLAGTIAYRITRRRAIRRAEREAVDDYLATRRARAARADGLGED